MLELGEHSAALHEDVGRAAALPASMNLSPLAVRQPRALADAAVAAGMARGSVRYFATSDEAAERGERRSSSDGDLVLVKGSRGMRTDVVVDRLKAELA